MVNWRTLKPRLPGIIAAGVGILITCVWTYWGVAEMLYEGWGMPFPAILRYLILAVGCLILTLLGITWSRIGGILIILIGGLFTIFWINLAINRGLMSWSWILSTFPISGFLVIIGVLFLIEGHVRRKRKLEGDEPSPEWWRRNLAQIIAIGAPLLIAAGVVIFYLPLLTSRIDDGSRDAALIEGEGVQLVWAPQGPGWNWKQSWGGYPSWDSLARYGMPPIGLEQKPDIDDEHASENDMQEYGLCRYLSADGRTLLDEPQDVWRMPTADEIVGSLVSGGKSAGCWWDGDAYAAECRLQPNKDTPLWASDEEPVYYWSGDEDGADEAVYVPYTGGVKYGGAISSQPKDWGNPRHGYRCVREP
ncbi:MAG: hypothetical protein U9R58_14960 [Chloroflexota bacterium]|nr:hypothetical protein [Chloroflexota bacterium]